MIIVGLDLSGKDSNVSGLCTLYTKDSTSNTFTEDIEKIVVENVFSNDEIIDRIRKLNPNITAIDAPFSYSEKGHWRKAELILLSRGFKPISTVFENMKSLVDRSIAINQQLIGYRKIETFSKAVEKILGIDKDVFIDNERYIIEKIGKWERGKISKDQYDSILCAICGLLHIKNKTESIGDKNNVHDQIILPLPDNSSFKIV